VATRVDARVRIPRTVVLVEGLSDAAAIQVLAERRGRELRTEGVSVVAIAGAKNIRRFLEHYGPRGLGVELAGLCDEREERDFRHGLERAGVATVRSTDALEASGFYVCRSDLEDELLRALGPEGVEAVIDAQGELASFRILQKQPAQRERSLHDQLRRFIGGRSGHKLRYARAFAAAMDLSKVPAPLDRLLSRV